MGYKDTLIGSGGPVDTMPAGRGRRPKRKGRKMLNQNQVETLRDYSGHVVSVERLSGEPATPQIGRVPVIVTMSTGWIVKLGQFGAVLSEQAPDDRRKALIAASMRVGMRLEFAREGRPAWTWLDGDGNVREGMSQPRVRFAPPWAEDPRQLTTMLARIDTCLNGGRIA